MPRTIDLVPRAAHVAKLVRFPPDVYGKLVALAERERRSVTAQIVRLVEQGLEQRVEASSGAPRARSRQKAP